MCLYDLRIKELLETVVYTIMTGLATHFKNKIKLAYIWDQECTLTLPVIYTFNAF